MPEGEIALALAELRNALEVGLARIDGQLALIAQRSEQTDKAVRELEERVAALVQTGGRWVVERTNKLRRCTERRRAAVEFFLTLARTSSRSAA